MSGGRNDVGVERRRAGVPASKGCDYGSSGGSRGGAVQEQIGKGWGVAV